MSQPRPPLRVLFVCTGNSARSQMAQALLNQRGRGAFSAASAGTYPAPVVHPLVVKALAEVGLDGGGLRPKTIDSVSADRWDLVITVCDQAKETCPVIPGLPMTAHWGVADPVEVVGDEAERLGAFRRARDVLRHRIDLLLALPFDKLERMALEARIRAIGTAGDPTGTPAVQ
jgi:protein-tyrosine-phosphatase